MKLLEKIKLFLSNTLYYPGCLTKFVLPEIEENYKSILEKFGVDYITISEINCCGSPALSNGYKDDFNVLKEKNTQILKDYGVGTIIFNCPACYSVFKKEYQGFKCIHITEVG